MNGWCKEFSNGAFEYGVSEKDWDNSVNLALNSVGISNNGIHIAIGGNGEYLQKQTNDIMLVAKELRCDDRFLHILRTEHSMMIKVISIPLRSCETLIADNLVCIPLEQCGHWLVLQYDTKKKEFSWSYSDKV